jgi:hypothetical protein
LRTGAAWLEDRRNETIAEHTLVVRASAHDARRNLRPEDQATENPWSNGPSDLWRFIEAEFAWATPSPLSLKSNLEVPRASQSFYKVMILGWRRTPGEKLMLERATAADPNILNVVSIKVSA